MKFREVEMDEQPSDYIKEVEVGSQASEEQHAKLLAANVEDVYTPECNQLVSISFKKHSTPTNKSIHAPISLQTFRQQL